MWRDDELPVNRAYAAVIQERLSASKAVVVLWSKAASESDWVFAEADWAREAGTLVQASLDGTLAPMPFNQIHCADLARWNGDTDERSWKKLSEGVAVLTGPAGGLDKALARRGARRRLSVCVLPFVNMSGDPEQEYFSEGISEDITTDLSKVSALDVIEGCTSSTAKNQDIDVCQIARKLGVSHLLEGSVRKVGNRIRITGQLIDGRTGGHIWAARYDRDATDIFAIQDEISQAIVSALRLKLLPEEKEAIERRGTTSAEAYNLYLLARQYWITGDFGDPRREERVIRICERAIALDANYARAWALKGLAQSALHSSYSGNDELDDGVAAAERAASLDSTIAEAHLPSAWRLQMLGRSKEATSEIEVALRLDPDCWEVNKEAGRIVFRQGKLERATKLLERATALMESDFHGWGMLSACYLAQGRMDGVQKCAKTIMQQVEAALGRDPDNGAALAFGAFSLAALGDTSRAREWVDRALLLAPENLYMRYYLVWTLLTFLNDREAAIVMLEPALAKGGRNLVSLAVADPNLDCLRNDPRFEGALAAAKIRVGQPQPEPVGKQARSLPRG